MSDRRLAATTPVGIGGVEVGDAERPSGVHQLECLLLAQAGSEELRGRPDAAEVPAPERDPRQLDPRAAEPPALNLERRGHRGPRMAGKTRTSNI